ncbi:MAG: PAS domain-containing protein [Pirellulales bacterium]
MAGLFVAGGIDNVTCRDMSALCVAIEQGVGVVVVSEEALASAGEALIAQIEAQPVWSDMPIIVLSRSGLESPALTPLLARLGNASVMERPVRVSTFVSIVRSAIRARLRQYEVREYLAERVRNEEALRLEREQQELIVHGADVGVWSCPLPFDRLLWDDKVKEHFHLPPDASPTIETFYERIHPDDRERTRSTIETSIEERKTYEIDYRTVSPDGGSMKWIRAVGNTYYDDAGKPLRFSGITSDVTNRIRVESELRAARNACNWPCKPPSSACGNWTPRRKR